MLLASNDTTKKKIGSDANKKKQQITSDERQQLRLKLQQLSSKVDATEFHLSRSLGKLVQATRSKCGLTTTSDEEALARAQVRPPLSPLPGQQIGGGRSTSISGGATQASNNNNSKKPAAHLLNKRRSLIAGLLLGSTGNKPAQVEVHEKNNNTISSLLTAAAAARRRQKRSRANELRHNAAKFLFTLVAIGAPFLFLTLTSQAAPISTGGVRPIWLSDGLLTVSDSSSADDVTQATADVAQELDQTTRRGWLEPEVPTGWLSGAQRQPAKRNERFWIERRRLNRDRALEPPAWLRERPIRRDQAMMNQEEEEAAGEEAAEVVDQETGSALERARLAAQDPSRPIMGRYGRGRQSRESSNELYAELLRHLIEEALESRAQLADFYDHLELAHQQDTSSIKKPLETGSGASGGGSKSSGELKSATGSAPADQTLVVAGDEISSTNTEDDAAAGSAPGQQQGAPVGPALAVVQRLTPIPMELLKQQAGEYVRLPTRLELVSGGGQDNKRLLELKEAAQVAPPAAAEEETFHVIEDIDRVVDASSQVGDSSNNAQPPVVQFGEEELEFEAPARMVPAAELNDDDELPVAAKAKRDASSAANQQQRVPLIPTAVALIRSGFFEREQLIQLAGKLRSLLENSLQLGRNSIVGLFPINARQLLVQLEPARLDALDRAQLAANFAYARDSPELVLSWPPVDDDDDHDDSTATNSALSASENPIPILQAILDSLNDNNNNDDAELVAPFQEQKKFSEQATNKGGHIWLPQRSRNLPSVGGEPLDVEVSRSWWNELSARPAAPAVNQRVPLAALAAYLNAVYAQRERAEMGVPEAAALTRQRNDTTNGSSSFLESGNVSYTIVLLLALMSACLVVKLLVRKFDRRQRRRMVAKEQEEQEMNDDDDDTKSTTKSASFVQTFWPFVSNKHHDDEATIKGTTGADGSGRTLNDANVHKLSADSGRDTLLTLDSETTSLASHKSRAGRVLRNKLDSLGARWTTFTSGRNQAASSDEEVVEKPTSQRSSANAGGFRTSTSYIKSLIEALTKSPAAGPETSSAQLVSINNDNSSEKLIDTANNSESDEILTSQMDISAAHLILDYMEKHLVDKERLRREWLELNAGAGKAAGKSASSPGDNKKNVAANQLILQRLARVALADENANKNRDSAIVPFDRNRVHLGTRQRHLSTGSPACNSSRNNNNNNKLRNGGTKLTSGDYVNASFIHDDDPRRPTHIIAQGPLESTCGQFWQMIWEQEISVIVMLTRLNENGHQQCACYWPTNIAPTTPTPSTSLGVAGGAVKSSTDSLRRGSVTSVFSGNGAHPHHHHHQQPIVAPNGDLNDNVLYFEVPLASASGTPRLSEEECEPEVAAPTASKQHQARTLKLEVHLISEHVSSSDYLVRNMYLVNGWTGETRTISQFHYLAWPASKTPDNVRQFLQFRRKVHKSYRQLKAPILVHCNDGAGRSGTYTLIDMILERIKNGAKEIDLRATLEHLRDQRVGLCETQSQFEFVLVALAEEIQIILEALPQ